MTKQLTTQNATITTATIQVQAMTIGARQVTLSVFRQLLEEPLIADDGTLNGVPWGVVNYHPDKCGDQPDHVHVVWQKGDELRRAAVQAPHAGLHVHPAADLYVQARIVHRTIHRPYSAPHPGDSLRLSEDIPGGWRIFNSGRFAYDGMAFQGSVPRRLRDMWRDERDLGNADRDAFEIELRRIGVLDTASHDSVVSQLLSMLPTAQYRQTVADLAELPQLFIAV